MVIDSLVHDLHDFAWPFFMCVWNYCNTKRSIYSKLIFEFPYQCLDSNLNLNWWYQEYPDDHPWHLFQLSLIFWASFAKQVSWKSFILLIKTAHILLLFNWIWEGQECHDDHPWHLFQYCILFWESFVKQVFWKSFILLIKTALSSAWRTGVSWWPSMIFTDIMI